MSEIVERFAREHFTLNSITERRQRQVMAALARFESFISPCPIEEVTDEELQRSLVSLMEVDGLGASSVAWHLRAIMSFYRWCWLKRVIDADSYLRLREVPAPRGANQHEPRPYSRKELSRMWAQLDAKYPYTTDLIVQRYRNGTSPTRSIRKHAMRLQLNAIIELALVCGLRQSEIFGLSIDDVHPDNKYVVVHGKRHDQHPKVRDVPYPDSAREAVQAWLRFRAYMNATTGSVWLSITAHEAAGFDAARPLNKTRMAHIMGSFGKWELHRLRHTCATERLRAGMPIESLQEFLGHANVNQTLRYAKVARRDVHKASAKVDAEFQAAIRSAA